MKELSNLLKRQFYTVIAVKKYILLVVLIGIATTFSDPSFIAFAGSMIIMALNYSVIAYEDKSKIGYLIYSLPVNPKKYVLSQYIYGFLITVLVMFITTVIFNIVSMFNLQNLEQITLTTTLISVLLISLVINTITVPIGIILGFQKARYIISSLAILPVIISPTLVKIISNININISENVLIILTLAGAAAFTIFSYIISSNLYCKRDIK